MMNPRSSLAHSGQVGFTLIEVMITVAIIAILSMVAYPSYRDYVIRGNIPQATSVLATKQVQMEQYFQDNRSYVGSDTGALPCASDSNSAKYFTFSCTGGGAPSATAYMITATGTASMAGFSYTINQTGAKTTGSVPSGWSLPSTNTCWVTKKGGIC